MRLMEPLDPPGHYDSSDPFGNIGGRSYPHTGSDFNGVPAGTMAHAIGSGVVVNKQWHDGNGNTVTVQLPDGHYYAYLHLYEPASVNVGDQVALGQFIGKVGNTGTNSVGAHLHITVSDSPSAYIGLGNKIDPWAFIQAHISDTDPAPNPSQPAPTQEEIDEMTASKDASIVRDYQSENANIVRTALIYPNGTAVRLTASDDVDALVTAHVQVYGIPLTNGSLNTVRERYGSQLTSAQWNAFWAKYPGTKVGSFA